MRLVLAAAVALAAAFSLPASASQTCLYLEKPGAPRHIVCTGDGCLVSVGFAADCSGSCAVNAGNCASGGECTVNLGTCDNVAIVHL
jgi:hypothetical protein